uniref:Uncharacterized protein n=1 Tax=Glossina austeni TaxID=7395 RepID=A0A1A9UQM6_GLOAU
MNLLKLRSTWATILKTQPLKRYNFKSSEIETHLIPPEIVAPINNIKDLETNNIDVMSRELFAPLQRKGFSAISSNCFTTKGEIPQASVLGLLLSSLYIQSPPKCVVRSSVNLCVVQSQTQLTGSQASNGNDSKLFLKATTLPCCI